MQENPESQEKKKTQRSFFEVPGVVKADKTEKPVAKPEKKIEQKVTEEPLVREEPKETDFKTSGVETGYTQGSWAKPEKSMEGKEAVDPSTLEREKPEERDFKAPGELETGYTEKSWAKPEETGETRVEAGKETEGEKRKEAGEEKSTTYSMKRRLAKSKKDKILFGVCGGLGEYFGIDSTLVRLVFVALTFFSFLGVFLYIILAIIMPPEESVEMIPSSQGRNLQK